MSSMNCYKFNADKNILFLPETNQLLVDGQSIRMEPLQVRLLQALIEHHGEVMSASRLADLVWQRTNVSDNLVRQVISQLRAHLSDGDRPHKIIQTIPKKGYLLLPKVHLANNDSPPLKIQPVDINGPQHKNRHFYTKLISVIASIAMLIITIPSVYLHFTNDINSDETISIYLSSAAPGDNVDAIFTASIQNYIYYTLRTARNITVFLKNKNENKAGSQSSAYSITTKYYLYGDIYHITINVYDQNQQPLKTFNTSFSKSDFLSAVGSLITEVKDFLLPDITNHSIVFKQETNTENYHEWLDISDGVVGLYQGKVHSTLISVMPKLLKLKENGNDTYLINALLAYSYSVKYLNQHLPEDKKNALNMARLAFTQDPLCDISNVALGLSLIINGKEKEAYPYLYYAVENSASPLSYYLISISAGLIGNDIGAALYKDKFIKMKQQAGTDFELTVSPPYNW
jgi:DNA-binding winged helix-turn-helix (wHTH) protein